LGHDATWLSKLVDSPLGRRITRTLRTQGVTPDVVWTDEGRQGTYYVEPGGKPRGTNVVYDRANAAITTARPEELATDRIETADVFHTTGITPALSETLAETTEALLSRAEAAGTTTVFDVNYRSKLWDPAEAGETLDLLLDSVDLLFVAERDAASLFDQSGTAGTVGEWFRETYDIDTVVVTRGEQGAIAVADEQYEQPIFESETVDPVGSGDAFAGGFLASWIDGDHVADALRYGAATAALKRTIGGDLALIDPEEVEQVVADTGSSLSR
jgi:2-dehydro-3-deoxygluconokinase